MIQDSRDCQPKLYLSYTYILQKMVKALEVLFVRHAESEDNIKVKAFCGALRRIKALQLPSWNQLQQSLKLLDHELDSQLSSLGKRQLIDMSMMLQARGFWQEDFDSIVYSPLIRAIETSKALMPPLIDNKAQCLDILREIAPLEQFSRLQVNKKLLEFELWLQDQSKTSKRILVIGHCQYFNNLLGMKTLMRNCDVWRSTVVFPSPENGGAIINGRLECTWSTPELLHRSALSQPHPIGKLMNGIWGFSGWGPEEGEEDVDLDDLFEEEGQNMAFDRVVHQQAGDEVVNDLDENEPMCRICQVSL